MSPLRLVRAIACYALLAIGVLLLAALCFLWAVTSSVLYVALPAATGRRVGRWTAMAAFRLFLSTMSILGAWRLDLSALDALSDEGPLIVAPNHPSLLDAVLIVSRLPNAFCVMKASLLGNFLLAPASRLARYIANSSLPRLAARAGDELHLGGQLVLFPEGTRSTATPLGPVTPAVGYVSFRTGVPVQAVFIHADTEFLGKGWSLLRCPELPLRYRVALGKRFSPPRDVRRFTQELSTYFAAELSSEGARAHADAHDPVAADPVSLK